MEPGLSPWRQTCNQCATGTIEKPDVKVKFASVSDVVIGSIYDSGSETLDWTYTRNSFLKLFTLSLHVISKSVDSIYAFNYLFIVFLTLWRFYYEKTKPLEVRFHRMTFNFYIAEIYFQ